MSRLGRQGREKVKTMDRKTGRVTSVVLLLLVSMVGGCGVATRAAQRPPTPITVVRPTPLESLAPRKGSIWQTTDRNTLFLDNKARNIGDIVTVYVVERSEAAKKANTKLDRNSDSSAVLTGAFNLTTLLGANTPLDQGAVGSAHKFQGKADTDRESELTATISCIVTEVFSNGNLRIEGRQDITVNNENQYILVSGIIRPEDISPQNSVQSFQMADARIEYSGEGDINDQQSPSWLNRFFSTVNLF